MRKEILLFIAIIDLGFSCFAFTGTQYFSPLYMVLILLLPLLSAVIFVFASTDYIASGKSRTYIAAAFAAASILLICLTAAFDQPSPYALSAALYVLWLLILASALSVAGIYLTGRAMRLLGKKNGKFAILAAVILLALTAGAAYVSQYGFGFAPWNAVDELACNYYSSYLFLHGINPYTQSMGPAMSGRGIAIPFFLDGSYDYTYHYPALSFLAYLPIAAMGITNLLSFIVVLTFLAVLASFEVYCKSGFNRLVLIPLAAWLGSSFFLSYNTNAYLAISVLLLFAYIYRDRIWVSGVLIGLAASAQQLSWFALPFFFLLTLREHGTRKMAKQMAFALAAFIAVNGYFIAISPGPTLNSIFGVFTTEKLPFVGTNITQFLLAFYPVPYGYSTLLCVMFFAASLLLFYFYGRSARTLLAVVPMFIFFLSWRNFAEYGLSYVPLLLAILYTSGKKEKKEADKLNGRKPMLLVLGVAVLIALSMTVYLHGAYIRSNVLKINSMVPVIYAGQGGSDSLAGVLVNLTNNGNAPENVSFYLVSTNPFKWISIAGSTEPPLGPGVTSTYQIGYSLPLIDNGTRLFLFVSSVDYITNRELNITVSPPSGALLPS